MTDASSGGAGSAGGEHALVWHRLIESEQVLRDGSGYSFEIAGRRVALFQLGEELFALDDECPHRGASLGMGIASEGEVGCPWHSWHFDLRTGRNTDGLEACVQVFPTRLEEGWVAVGLAPEPPSLVERAAEEAPAPAAAERLPEGLAGPSDAALK